MKKLFCFLICLFLAIGLAAVNTTTPGTGITDEGGGWYSIPTAHFPGVNWIVNYTVGNSTSITMKFAYTTPDTSGPGATTKIMISDKSSANIMGDLTAIMDASAVRVCYVVIPNKATKVYIQIVYAAGTTGKVSLYGLLDHSS